MFVRLRSLRRTDHSSRGVLPGFVYLNVIMKPPQFGGDDHEGLSSHEGMVKTEVLTFRHRASCILRQAFHYSPENAFYIFNQQIYFII